MIRLILSSLILFACVSNDRAEGKTLTIAVIDTGFTATPSYPTVNLCKYGHKDVTKFSITNNVPQDLHGHGTNVAYLIEKQLQFLPKNSYCLVIIKYYKETNPPHVNADNYVKALKHAYNINVAVINYSGNGQEPLPEESVIIKKYLDRGGIFVAAAGNEGSEIATNPIDYSAKRMLTQTPYGYVVYEIERTHNMFVNKKTPSYPALVDPRIVVVGSLDKNGKKLDSSNFGDVVDVWESGENQEGGGIVLTGTSQATAITTGKMVKKLILEGKANVR